MPNTLTQLSAIGRQAVENNDWDTVQACAQKLLQQEPENSEAYFLSGLFEKAQSRPLKAISAFELALDLNPERYDAAIELANQYSIAQRNSDAAELVERYEEKLINSPRYLDLAGTVYTQIGMAEKAWPLYVKANELQPDIELFQGNLAACGVYLGKINEAKEIYQRLLESRPNHQRNHYYFSRLEKAESTAHIEQMEKILSKSNLPPSRNIFLYYALGKELEDMRQWDKSFHYYSLAGNAAKNVSNYDIKEDTDLIDKIIEVCNSDWLRDVSSPIATETTERSPIFIVGLPRTGTTLTERILDSHSKVHSLGETQFMPMVIRRESGVKTTAQVTQQIVEEATKTDITKIARGYIEATKYRQSEAPFFVDKLPYNFLFIGFIAKAFPNSRIIHLHRNPVDACFAMYKQVFTWAYKFSYNLEDLGHYYIAYRKLLQHWRDCLGEKLIEVKYENLVSDQENQTRLLLNQLGLKFEEACLNFHENRSASTTASSVQIREKIHNRSINRWINFQSQLKPLTNVLKSASIELT